MQVFKRTAEAVAKELEDPEEKIRDTSTEEGAVAKVLEELKLMVRELPMHLQNDIMEEGAIRPSRKRRRFHPMFIDELSSMISSDRYDPIGILMIASLLREDFPWLYEIGSDAYKSAKNGNAGERAKEAIRRFRDATDYTLNGPFRREMGISTRDLKMWMGDLPKLIDDHLIQLQRNPAKTKSKSQTKKAD